MKIELQPAEISKILHGLSYLSVRDALPLMQKLQQVLTPPPETKGKKK